MVKKVFLSVFVVVLVGVVWFGYGVLNLKMNSVYYAHILLIVRGWSRFLWRSYVICAGFTPQILKG